MKTLKRSCIASAALTVPLATAFAPAKKIPFSHSPLQASNSGFDYSSKAEWDRFYETGQGGFEWHSALDLSKIAAHIPIKSDILMVGCGDSELPAVTLTTRDDTHVTLLDTSQVCMDQMEAFYGDAVKYQCGDATKLTNYFDDASFDIVVDKGLMDALLCSEGWDYYVEQLLQGSSNILKSGSGQYLLISYRLPQSHQDFLEEVGARSDVGLKWKFNLPDSTDKISVSVAHKV